MSFLKVESKDGVPSNTKPFDFGTSLDSYLRESCPALFSGPDALPKVPSVLSLIPVVSSTVVSSFLPEPIPQKIQDGDVSTSSDSQRSSRMHAILEPAVSASSSQLHDSDLQNTNNSALSTSQEDPLLATIDISPIKQIDSPVRTGAIDTDSSRPPARSSSRLIQNESPSTPVKPKRWTHSAGPTPDSSLFSEDSQDSSLGNPQQLPLNWEIKRVPCAACHGTKSSIRCVLCRSCWHLNCCNLVRDDLICNFNRDAFICPVCLARADAPAETRHLISPSDADCKTDPWSDDENNILRDGVRNSRTGKPNLAWLLPRLPGRSLRSIMAAWRATHPRPPKNIASPNSSINTSTSLDDSQRQSPKMQGLKRSHPEEGSATIRLKPVAKKHKPSEHAAPSQLRRISPRMRELEEDALFACEILAGMKKIIRNAESTSTSGEGAGANHAISPAKKLESQNDPTDHIAMEV